MNIDHLYNVPMIAAAADLLDTYLETLGDALTQASNGALPAVDADTIINFSFEGVSSLYERGFLAIDEAAENAPQEFLDAVLTLAYLTADVNALPLPISLLIAE